MHHGIPDWIYITFTAVTAVGVLMQALVLLGMLVALKGALGRLNEISKKAEEHVVPVLQSTRSLLEEVSPKLKVAAQNALEVSQTAREVSQTVKAETARVAVSVDELMEKALVQADRVDEMVTATLNTVAHVTSTVQKTVSGPVRQVNALLNGLRAGFEVLRSKEREVHAAADGDRFV
jgi:methyl-accepting chemotaxis protein